jgi:tetratricopeptide (TPR) repeat protein
MSDARRLLLITAVLAASSVLAACSGAETRKVRYLEKAGQLVEAGDLHKAQIELRNALQIDPNYVAAQVLMGRVAEDLDDPRRALQMYQAALDQDPSNVEARAGLAKIHVFGGLPEKAMELVEPGLVQAPGDPRLLTVRAAAKARLGDREGAIADAQLALQTDPRYENAVALLAAMYVETGRAADARNLVAESIKALPESVDLRVVLASLNAGAGQATEAVRLLREIVELQPEQLGHRFRLAQYLTSIGQADDAEATLRAAIAQSPRSLAAKQALVALLRSRGDLDAAERQLLGFVEDSPADPELRVALGDFYGSRGKAAAAAAEYDEAIRLDGDGPQALAARNRLAAAALAEKRFEDARAIIEQVLAENPQDNDALILRADIALANGDTAAAITDLRSVQRDQPASVPVQRALARAYLQSGDLALAEETLRKSVDAVPDDPQLRVDLAGVLLQTGQSDRALQLLQDLVAEKPDSIPAQELLFQIHFQRKELGQARSTADAVRSARPDMATGHYLAGLVDRAEGKDQAAIESFEAALKLQPNAAEPLTGLVALLASNGRVEEALATLARLTAAQPGNGLVRNLRGEVLMAAKRHEEAAEAFAEAIKLSPVWWLPYRGKADAELANGDVRGAIGTLEAGLAAGADPVKLGIMLAALHERSGDVDAAIVVYENLAKRSPVNDLVANNLAMLLAEHRKDTDSLERALALSEPFKNSGNAALLDTYGWVKYRLGRYAEAVSTLQRAAEKSADSAHIRYHLAMAQLKAGQREDARRNLEAALRAEQVFPGRNDAEAALSDLEKT